MNADFMQPVFKNNLHNSYLILKAGTNQEKQYQCKMAENNEIPGLLRLSTEVFDGNLSYYYEITDMQNLAAYTDKWGLNYGFLFQFLKSVSIVTNEVRNYLMDASHLIIEKDYIFYDEAKERFGYCFHPDYRKNVADNLYELSREWTQRGAEDEKGRLLLKELQSKVEEHHFSIDKILDLAAGKYYENHNVRFDVKENLEHIHSQILEEEINEEEGTASEVPKGKRRFMFLKSWFTYIHDKISRR